MDWQRDSEIRLKEGLGKLSSASLNMHKDIMWGGLAEGQQMVKLVRKS